MKELEEKYKMCHKNTDEKWKFAVIDTYIKDPTTYVDTNQSIDWLYDDALDFLFSRSKRRIINLAKRLGYDQIPCEHCRNIIKYWDKSKEVGYLWFPDYKHLF